MNLQPLTVKDAGNLSKERLVFTVAEDATELGEQIIMACPSSEGGMVIPEPKFVYWFNDTKVNTGDLVVLYSKSGDNKQKPRSKTTKTYFFYWSLDQPIWGDGELSAVILHSDDWEILDFGPDDTEPEKSP
jgi:hypothetical protein